MRLINLKRASSRVSLGRSRKTLSGELAEITSTQRRNKRGNIASNTLISRLYSVNSPEVRARRRMHKAEQKAFVPLNDTRSLVTSTLLLLSTLFFVLNFSCREREKRKNASLDLIRLDHPPPKNKNHPSTSNPRTGRRWEDA